MADNQSAKEIADALKGNKDLNETTKDTLKTLNSVSKAYENINAKITAARDTSKDLKSLEDDLQKSLTSQIKAQTELNKLQSTNSKAVSDALSLQIKLQAQIKEEHDLEVQLNQALTSKNKKERETINDLKKAVALKAAEIELTKSGLEGDVARATALLEITNLSQKTTKELQEQYLLEKQITEQMGLGGNAAKALYKVLDSAGMGSLLKMDEITKSMRKAAEDGKNKWQVLGAGIKSSFASIGDALRDPLVLIGGIVTAVKTLINLSTQYRDKQFEAGKALGMGVTESGALLNNFNNIAKSNSSLAMTAKQLVESYSQINAQLGFIGPNNAEFLTTTTGIQRRIGATSEDMLSLQYSAVKSGKTLSQTYQSVIGIAKQTGARLKLNMSEKQILGEISKVSATVFNNFRGNVKELAKSVVQATKLGVTLDQIQSAGLSMLDFESSISKQFEAQLLSGRELDLTKARELALTGNTKDLMTEITKQLGSQAQWNDMNVLAQQSYAEALGMSKEQVDEIFRKQELAGILGEDASKSLQTQYDKLVGMGYSYDQISEKLGEQAAADALRTSSSEKMAATMENIKDSIGKMTEGLAAFVDKFATFIGDADNLKGILTAIGAIMGGIAGYSVAISIQKQRQLATELQLQFAQTKILAGMATEMGANSAIIAQEQMQAVLGKKNAIIGVGEAVTKVTAGSAALGPGALLVGAAVGAGLMALLGSYGIGGASSPSIGAPSIPSPIAPMNTAAAGGASQANQDRMLGRPIVIENKVYSEIKAENRTIAVASNTGNKQSAHIDNQTGYIG